MKTAAISFGLFILTVAMGSVICVVWLTQLPPSPAVSTEPITFDTTNTVTAELTDQTTITDPVSNSSVFSSTGLPIQFSYPNGWLLSPETTATSDFAQLTDYTPTDQDASLDRIPGHKLEVVLITLESGQTVLDWLGNPKKYTIIEVAGMSSWRTQNNAYAAATIGVHIPSPADPNQFVAFSLYGPESTPAELTTLFDTFVASITVE